ncbi:MAG: hypothetical protein NC118_04385 [Eubacterium sp.]|nr:hypothetical protein [Eubacterium sp.]
MKIRKIAAMAATASIGAMAGALYEGIEQEKRMDKMEETTDKFRCFYHLLTQWLALKQDGKNLKEYFEINEYKTVAVYGMKELGERLVEELKDSGITIRYVVDKDINRIVTDLPKYTPDDALEKVDVMVVTAVYYYQDIEEKMSEKVDFPIISLEDVVYGLA